MSTLSRGSVGAGIGLGVITLYGLPVVRLLVLYACLGAGPLTALMFIEGMIAGARALSPLRSSSWFEIADADAPRISERVIGLELAVSAFAVALIAATARWWQPHVGIAPPLWLIALIGVRYAGMFATITLSSLKRPFAAFAVLFDLAITMPLVAVVGRSLEAVVIGSTLMTVLLTLIAARSSTFTELEKRTGKKLGQTKRAEAEESPDRWRLGSWLDTFVGNNRRLLFVAIAGVGVLIPFSASLIVSSLLLLPFLTASTILERPSSLVRAMIGLVATALGFVTVHELGPAIYRAIYPDAFGDGRWLEILAWTAIAILPLTLRTELAKSSQWRIGAASLISLGLHVGLALAYGTPGFLAAVAASATVISVVGMTSKDKPILGE